MASPQPLKPKHIDPFSRGVGAVMGLVGSPFSEFVGSMWRGWQDGSSVYNNNTAWGKFKNGCRGLATGFLYGVAGAFTAVPKIFTGVYKGWVDGPDAAYKDIKDNFSSNAADSQNNEGNWAKSLLKGTGQLLAGVGVALAAGGVGFLKTFISRPLATAVGATIGFIRGTVAGPLKVAYRDLSESFQKTREAWKNTGNLRGNVEFARNIIGDGMRILYNGIVKPIGNSILNLVPFVTIDEGTPGPYVQALKGGMNGLKNGFEGGNVFVPQFASNEKQEPQKNFLASFGRVISGSEEPKVLPSALRSDHTEARAAATVGVRATDTASQQSQSPQPGLGNTIQTPAHAPVSQFQSQAQGIWNATIAGARNAVGDARTSLTHMAHSQVQAVQARAQALGQNVMETISKIVIDPTAHRDIQQQFNTLVFENTIAGKDPIGAYVHLRNLNHIDANRTFTYKMPALPGRDIAQEFVDVQQDLLKLGNKGNAVTDVLLSNGQKLGVVNDQDNTRTFIYKMPKPTGSFSPQNELEAAKAGLAQLGDGAKLVTQVKLSNNEVLKVEDGVLKVEQAPAVRISPSSPSSPSSR